jgi:hypothetical protein
MSAGTPPGISINGSGAWERRLASSLGLFEPDTVNRMNLPLLRIGPDSRLHYYKSMKTVGGI